MPLRSRPLVRTAVFIVGGLVMAYFLFGWFGFEPLVKWAAPKFITDKTSRHLTMEQARFDPLRLSVDLRGVTLTEPDGKPLLKLGRLFVDFEAVSLFKRAYVFDEIRLSEPAVQVELRADGHLNWLDFVDAFSTGAPPSKEGSAAPRRLLVRRSVLEQGHVQLIDHKIAGGFETSVEPLELQLDNLSTLPEDRGGYTLSAKTALGATVRWKGDLSLNPVTASGELAVNDIFLARLWPFFRNVLNMTPPEGTAALSLAYRASYANRQVDLKLDRVEASLDKLLLRGPQDSTAPIALDAIRLSGGHVDLAKQEAGFDAVTVDGGRVAIELDAQGRPQLLDWLKPPAPAAAATAPMPAASASAPPSTASTSPTSPWRVGIARVGVDHLAVGVTDRGFVTPLAAQAGQLKLQFKAGAEFGPGEPQLNIDGLGLQVTDVAVSSGEKKPPWFRLASAELSDGRVGLAGRELALGRVAVSGGRVEAVRDARGTVSLLDALQRHESPATASKPPPAPASKSNPWRYRVGKIDAQDFQLNLREESVTPPVTLNIEQVSASAEGLSDDPKAELPVKLQFRVKQGGQFEASGRVSPAGLSAELNLKLTELALTPAQPLLAKTTNLVLASGKVETQGRLRYQRGKASYDGAFAVKQLQLNEAGTNDPILGWKSLSSKRLAATQERLQIGELGLDGLNSKLVIFKDRTVNVTRLFKPEAKSPASPSAASAPAGNAAPYRVDVASVRVTNGEMDFADLSLALPFGARINNLKGQMVGLSSRPGGAAQVEFDGVVDQYGLARAVGQINLFDPTGFTDLKVVFRNVEMTTLTPYSATFAGRKIESGKLSLDLEYKIKQRQLAGENQIVMDKLTLGERVESPTAMSLPLDLAIAILADSDGKIDLGLPVSGSLDDPQFSYGQIVWKAIVNVITKVITSPFRALGAALGIDGEKLDKIAFDGGSAELAPPEQEKLANLAKLMGKRAGIALSVHADFDPKADREAIKEFQLRRAVAQQNGRTLTAGEDPGPISTAQPATREALEQLFEKRLGAEALASLQQRFQQANPDPAPTNGAGRLVSRLSSLFKAKPAPLSAAEAQRLRGADLHALMLQALLDADVVDEARLRTLAAQRGDAIRGGLVKLGVAADRIRVEEPQSTAGKEGTVNVALSMVAGAKSPAAATGVPAATSAASAAK